MTALYCWLRIVFLILLAAYLGTGAAVGLMMGLYGRAAFFIGFAIWLSVAYRPWKPFGGGRTSRLAPTDP